VDRVIIAHAAALWPWLLLLIGSAVLTFAMAHLRRYYSGVLSLSVQYDLRNAVHDHLLAMDQDSLARMPTGQLVSRANSDSALVQALLNFIPMMSNNILLMLVSLAVMLWLSPLLALIAIVVLPTLFLVSYRMRTRVFPASWEGQQREGDVAQIVDEAVNGVRVVKAFGQEGRELRRVATAAETLYGARMRTVRLQSRFQPLMESVPTVAQVAILGFGGWLALCHSIPVGTFLAFSTYVAQFSAPARSLANVVTVGQQARAGVERIFKLLDRKPAIADAPGAVELPARPRGEVVFEGVHFGYRDSDVLRGVDLRIDAGERVAIVGASGSGKSTVAALVSRFLTIRPGETVALVGETGAGKSTVMKLLARFYDPDSGSVTADAHDLRTIDLHGFRTQLGYVPQEPFLFSGTVRDNIAYGRPAATDAEVEAAARAVGAHDLVTTLPGGYLHELAERGRGLSAGQRQLLALARAEFVDPAILLLDEATSNLDLVTEARVAAAMRRLTAHRTTVVIAHRLQTARGADRIFVLDRGTIAEVGPHEELLEAGGRYARMWQAFELVSG
jgi:ATP-binding cassette subfamily B protein